MYVFTYDVTHHMIKKKKLMAPLTKEFVTQLSHHV